LNDDEIDPDLLGSHFVLSFCICKNAKVSSESFPLTHQKTLGAIQKISVTLREIICHSKGAWGAGGPAGRGGGVTTLSSNNTSGGKGSTKVSHDVFLSLFE